MIEPNLLLSDRLPSDMKLHMALTSGIWRVCIHGDFLSFLCKFFPFISHFHTIFTLLQFFVIAAYLFVMYLLKGVASSFLLPLGSEALQFPP